MGNPECVTILLAEDDDDDYFLTAQALHQARLLNPVQRVSDGEELMDYLHRRGKYRDLIQFPPRR